MDKKELGQFFTTNADYILSNFDGYVKNCSIIDPFAGNEDLLRWALGSSAKNIRGFDIDASLIKNNISYNDSLLNIEKSDFILTNPPYLAKNKADPATRLKYLKEQEDLYLVAIDRIIKSGTNKVIIIVPINFLSSTVSAKIRKSFIDNYNIVAFNYFKERVFADTTYNVCAIYAERKCKPNEIEKLFIHIYPDNFVKEVIVERKYNYSIAGKEIHEIKSRTTKIHRLTEKEIQLKSGDNFISCFINDTKTIKNAFVNSEMKSIIDNNIILIHCIDGKVDKIRAQDIRELDKKCLIGKNTSRNIAHIIMDEISIKDQEKLILKFNDYLSKLRNNYCSLFMTNFRDNDRKRIEFDFCYKLLEFLM
jgi:hypothetical protein